MLDGLFPANEYMLDSYQCDLEPVELYKTLKIESIMDRFYSAQFNSGNAVDKCRLGRCPYQKLNPWLYLNSGHHGGSTKEGRPVQLIVVPDSAYRETSAFSPHDSRYNRILAAAEDVVH